MTRREIVKTTIGALVGISAIPAVGQKPRPSFQYEGPITWINPATYNPDPSGYWKVMMAAAYQPKKVPAVPMRWVEKNGGIFAEALP